MFAELFIASVRDLLAAGKRADAIDLVHDRLDEALLYGRIDEASSAALALAESDVPQSLKLSALTVMRPWRALVPEAYAAVSRSAGADN